MINLRKVKWALRRIHVPVGQKDLVLEVGSGGNPYPRANVLVDAYEETQERHWDKLVHDRPTILANGEKLPFNDKVFDFVIAAHVLEHTSYPERFLAELQRVAKAGYIETPDAFMERINPYKDHRLEVTVRNKRLIIRKKKQWDVDPELVELYEYRNKLGITQNFIPAYPEDFHVRYYWRDKIEYEVLNPAVDATWQSVSASHKKLSSSVLARIKNSCRQLWLKSLRYFFSQRSRNSLIDLKPLLRCPSCNASQFVIKNHKSVHCEKCGANYYYRKGILVMNEKRN
jgi:SAM-dependent methyltransferase